MNSIIVHQGPLENKTCCLDCLTTPYQEIALKGRNRPCFIHKLARNIRRLTAGVGVVEVHGLMGRIELVLEPGADYSAVRERLQHVFGIANFSMAGRAPVDLDASANAILADLADHETGSVRVRVLRSEVRLQASLSTDGLETPFAPASLSDHV